MKKSTVAQLMVASAALGGVFYYLFYTDRGRQFTARLLDDAAAKLDEFLGSLENKLEDAEETALKREKD